MTIVGGTNAVYPRYTNNTKDSITITGHTLSGYVAGDVLPASVWDLSHRPKSEPEGMAYIDGIDMWAVYEYVLSALSKA